MNTEYAISQIIPDGQHVKRFILTPVSEKITSFLPGQFVKLALKKDGQCSIFRPYSIASAPDPNGTLEFCIKMEGGQLTALLANAVVGDTVAIDGPYGHFTYQGDTGAVFMAGGTGIAPIMSMVRSIVAQGIKGNFFIVYSNKTEKDILYRKELAEFGKHRVAVIHTLTREEETSAWKGARGRISKELIWKCVTSAHDKNWYFCGPLAMVTEFKKIAIDVGADSKRIKLEGWG